MPDLTQTVDTIVVLTDRLTTSERVVRLSVTTVGGRPEVPAQEVDPVYFCDPGSPGQRGTNENTNGLLRQNFPKGTNFAGHTPHDLAAVAAELNSRPRKTLDLETSAERLHRLLAPTT